GGRGEGGGRRIRAKHTHRLRRARHGQDRCRRIPAGNGAMIYHCCDERRRLAVRQHAVLNGIDYVEVLDAEAIPLASPRQRTLLVRFVKAAPALTAENFEITGGERIDDVGIEWATRADAPDAAVTTPAERAFLAAMPDPEEVIA